MVGREREIDELTGLLKEPDIRLITLHGLGGTGKTRLAFETAQAALDLFPDGVWFVALAPLNSPEQFISATAAALGFSFHGPDDQKGQLLHFLQSKKLLLIFDNLEHLLPEGAAYLEELLQNATEARLLVTSRQPINAVWEWVYPLHGLEYESPPSANEEIPAAARLFLQHLNRAGAPAAENDPACAAQICRIVEGLPLALILAASWGRTLGCEGIAEEIRRSVRFLQTQQRDIPEKHSSMHAVFDYSWQLLSDQEQAVLRRLSVFSGGFDRDAATEVAEANLSLLAALLDQSLIDRVPKDRYQIHELLRQYLEDRLVEAGEEKSTRDQHLAYYTGLAEQAEPELTGKHQKAWIEKLGTEIDNLRVALDWSLASEEIANLERGLRLIASSERLWLLFSYINDGYSFLTRALERRSEELGDGPLVNAHARGLNVAAKLSSVLEDLPAMRRFAGEALQIGLELRDPRLMGDAYYWQADEAGRLGDSMAQSLLFESALENYGQCGYLPGMIQAILGVGLASLNNGDFPAAFSNLSRALELARKQEDVRTIYQVLRYLGQLGLMDPQIGLHRARDYYAAGLQYARDLEDKRYIVIILCDMGELARLEGELEEATAIFEEAISIASEIGLRNGRIISELNLGFVYLRLGKYDQSEQLFTRNLVASQLAEYSSDELALCLLGLAGLMVAMGRAQLAARILGAIERENNKELLRWPTDRNEYQLMLAWIKAQLTEQQFDELYKEGQALSLGDAAQLVQRQGLREEGRDVERISKLTKREIEVLRLIAQGLSDAQVAERLVLSPRTVNAHLTSVYRKIDVNSRAAATRFAIEHGLA